MAILSKKTLWEGKFLRSVLITYETRLNGSDAIGTRKWEAIERVNCRGIACIVPFTDDGDIILIRQFRPPIGQHVVELPAGLADSGESLVDSARRELIEETGYEAERMEFLTEGPMSSGASSEILTVFVGSGLRYVGIGARDETEDIETLKVPVARLAEVLEERQRKGDAVDLKVYGLAMLAREHMAREGKRR